jgi:hypothetical protein
MMKRITVILMLSFTFFAAFSKDVVQFSGFVRDATTNSPIPFSAIYVQNENRGTISGYDGFFTFVVGKGDTILVKSLGFKVFKVVVPADLDVSSFTKEITLERDVYELDSVVIAKKRLPTPGQLGWAIANLDIPNSMQELAQKTIEQSILNDEISRNTKYDGKENFNQYVQSQADYYYNRNGNQRPGISLTNPFAWASFIKDIKAKKKKKQSGK